MSTATMEVSISTEQFAKAVKDIGGAVASAWSEAANTFKAAVQAAEATRLLSEAEKLHLFLDAWGPKYDQLTNQAKAFGEAATARGDNGMAALMQKWEQNFANQAATILDSTVSEVQKVEKLKGSASE